MMQQQQATSPSTYNEILETEYEIQTVESKRGDETIYTPKVLSKGTEYNVFFSHSTIEYPIPCWVKMGRLGDHSRFNKPLDQACATLTMTKGCAFNKVKQTMPTLQDNQQKSFDILEQQHVDFMTEAFTNKKVKCSGKDKARKKASSKLKKEGKKPTKEQIDELALKIYIEDSHDSGMKEMTWTNNGEEITDTVLKLKRKVRGVQL